MDYKRNRLNKLTEYLKTLNIDVNIGKNKARGNKGIFLHKNGLYRIDVSKNLTIDETISVILHEFAHYIHLINDKSLQSLDFIFSEEKDKILEELLRVTVKSIPRDFANEIFSQKNTIKSEIKELSSQIKCIIPNFSISNNCIEKNINLKYRYLLKYDVVKIFNKVYSIDKINTYNELKEYEKLYIKLQQKKRLLNRINSRINKINKYYNNKTELFARFVENYFTNRNYLKIIAPTAIKSFDNLLLKNKNHEFNKIKNILT